MKLIELILNELNEFGGISALSVVENPAIEEDFIFLNKQKEIKLAQVNGEKRILMGGALIPDKHIVRFSEELGEYYVFFSKDTVKRASELFLMKGNQNNSTLEHQYKLNGMSVVESWIVEDMIHDKSAKYNLNLPIGSWVVSVKVDNEEVWDNYVKTGKVKGFSIEGMFLEKMAMEKYSKEEYDALELIKQMTEAMKMKQE